MRKKLDTRFPASRIKKIMQADEDVGKIALPVPVLVSKALELFLQDLCDRTYDITLQKGLKTVSALHLKQCVHSYNVFDFLKDTVSKVPDLGGPDPGADDRSSKRRKTVDESNESDEDLKRFKTQEITASQSSSSASSRGRGRGRGRGRPRGSGRGGERDSARSDRFVDDHPDTSLLQHNNDNRPVDLTKSFEEASDATEEKETTKSRSNTLVTGSGGIVRNFDLNLDLDENGDAFAANATFSFSAATATSAATSSSSGATTVAADATTTTPATAHHHQMKHEEFTGWPLSDIDKMAMDPHRFNLLNTTIEEEEEDYDNE